MLKNHLPIFLLLSIIVILFHFLIGLKYLNYGFHSDDWNNLIKYKILVKEDFLSKAKIIWRDPNSGPHTTSQILYIGVLEKLFGLNYTIFNSINILSKILATISIYPLILLVFRRRLLAFLTTVFYEVSSSTVGSFHLVVKGTEYQAIFFMNIFLIIYIYLIRKQIISLKWICALILSFSIAILLAPPRLFPLAFFPLLIEFFLWIHTRPNYNLKFGLRKLFFLYIPFILLFIYRPSALTESFIVPTIHFKKIVEGYWFILLSPFSGLGYMIFWNSYWVKAIGNINIDNFKNYLLFISHTTFIFGLIGAFFAFILSKNKRGFIPSVLVLYLLFEILVFFLATNHLRIPLEIRPNFDFNALYSIFVGMFIVIISISCYAEWLKTDKKNGLLLALWSGPLLSLLFISGVWLFADYLLGYTPTHEYLTVPAIGISLATSALLISVYDKIRYHWTSHLGNALAFCVILFTFFPLYLINKNQSDEYLYGLLKSGGASQQQNIQQKIRRYLNVPSNREDKLVFFNWSNDQVNATFYSETIYSSFTAWMHYYEGDLLAGCISQVFDKTILIKSITQRDGEKGFLLSGICIDKQTETYFTNQQVFYKLSNFYALEIYDNNLIDIKNNILKDIGVN